MGRRSIVLRSERVEQRIYLIRGHKVMLGPDLAELYGVETRALMQAVKRNRERFPGDFMFALSREEISRISQTVISLKYSKAVCAFTEQGVAMLSSVLNSSRAIQVNIEIMRAFVRLRGMIASHDDLARKLDALEKKYDAQFKGVFDAMRELTASPAPQRRRVGFLVREKMARYSSRR